MRSKLFLWSIILLLIAITAFMFIGLLQKPEYKGSVGKEIAIAPEQIWQRLTNVEGFPSHHESISEVRLLGQNEKGFAVWEEKIKPMGTNLMEFIEMEPYSRLKVRTKKSNTGLKGSWLYELEKRGAKTYVRLTEESRTSNVFMRGFFAFIGRESIINQEIDLLTKMK